MKFPTTLLRITVNVFACWITSIMWAWFAEPLGLPHLRWLHVLGFDLMLAAFRGVWVTDLITWDMTSLVKHDVDPKIGAPIATIVLCTIVLSLGWVTHWLLVHT